GLADDEGRQDRGHQPETVDDGAQRRVEVQQRVDAGPYEVPRPEDDAEGDGEDGAGDDVEGAPAGAGGECSAVGGGHGPAFRGAWTRCDSGRRLPTPV